MLQSIGQWIDHLSANNLIRDYPVIAKLEQAGILGWKASGAVNSPESELEVERLDKGLPNRLVKHCARIWLRRRMYLANVRLNCRRNSIRVEKCGCELENRLLAVLESNTWKMIEPVRSVLRLLNGRNRPPPFGPQLLDRKSLTLVESKT